MSVWSPVDGASEIQFGPRPRNASCPTADDLPLPLIATGTGTIYEDVAASNFTYYDEEVTNVTPLVMALFSNSNSTTQQFQQTEMFCLRPKNITAGSRVPEKVAGAAPRLEIGRMVTIV